MNASTPYAHICIRRYGETTPVAGHRIISTACYPRASLDEIILRLYLSPFESVWWPLRRFLGAVSTFSIRWTMLSLQSSLDEDTASRGAGQTYPDRKLSGRKRCARNNGHRNVRQCACADLSVSMKEVTEVVREVIANGNRMNGCMGSGSIRPDANALGPWLRVTDALTPYSEGRRVVRLLVPISGR